MKPLTRAEFAGFAAGILAILLVSAIQGSLRSPLHAASPFLLFVVPVALAAAIGGAFSGILTTALGLLTAIFLFVGPGHTLSIGRASDAYGAALYLGTAILISLLYGALHRSRNSIESERALLRSSERRFRQLAETVPSMVWTAAPDGALTFANQAWFRYCGLDPARNVREWPELVLHPDDAERCMSEWRKALAEGTEYEVQVRNRRHDGAYRWFVTRALPLRDEQGRIVSWFGVTTDVHDLKEMQAALQTADRRKDEFLATLAHELRNPLAPLRNALEIARLGAPDPRVLNGAFELMERQLGHIVRLVDDLLDVSRIAQGKLELRREPLEIGEVVRAALDTSRPAFEAGGTRLETRIPRERLFVIGDRARLEQVFSNLLNNAVKYSDPGGTVRLEVEREHGSVLVRVRDEGIGIAPEMLPRVFEMFTQLDGPAQRSQGGLGIGLALVKRLVEAHGGSVEMSSQGPGRGSDFVVLLPVSSEASAWAAGQGRGRGLPRETRGGRRILVVDDNHDAARSLATLLEMLGNDVRAAYDGVQAVEEAAGFAPDLIFLDLDLPRLDGYEAARRIRATEGGRAPVLVALTGWGQDADRARSAEAGFDRHIVKPVDLESLQELLARTEAEVQNG